jgi:hypothetical protein
MLDLSGLVDLLKELSMDIDEEEETWCKVLSDGSGKVIKGEDEVVYEFDDEDSLLEIILDYLNSVDVDEFSEEMDL